LILNPAADQAMLKSAFDSIQVNLEKSLVTSADKYDLRNSLFKIPLYIAINVKFDGIPIENLSMGQRAIVLLQIILAYDKTPLLIDQPEEALDNKYIYEKLVTVLRKAKKNRQIIIVTHNANLVVNTDSEQVIVAENNDNEISYSVGTIEDPDTQERIKSILEGGKEAFEKREQKYGYIRK
jgi:ABC-type cobalamin/Fe3+-siderophores transport system ATPase subunit